MWLLKALTIFCGPLTPYFCFTSVQPSQFQSLEPFPCMNDVFKIQKCYASDFISIFGQDRLIGSWVSQLLERCRVLTFKNMPSAQKRRGPFHSFFSTNHLDLVFLYQAGSGLIDVIKHNIEQIFFPFIKDPFHQL